MRSFPRPTRLFLLGLALVAPTFGADYLERYDTLYNSLTIERRGTQVELRARSREGDYLESAVDLADPLKLVVPYTRSLYAGLFFQPKPERVLMIGLGGAGFHRLFMAAYPQSVLQSVELDPKVVELTRERMYFTPTVNSPIATQDGRQFIKRNRETWDWIILDAFRGGFVPPHLKTKEFYQECAARLGERGVFITNLHSGTELYYADLKTLREVFPQVILFQTQNRGNVIACAVKYASPDVTKPEAWPPASELNAPLLGRLDLGTIRTERIDWPTARVNRAKVMTDDFSPVEFLDAMNENNTKR